MAVFCRRFQWRWFRGTKCLRRHRRVRFPSPKSPRVPSNRASRQMNSPGTLARRSQSRPASPVRGQSGGCFPLSRPGGWFRRRADMKGLGARYGWSEKFPPQSTCPAAPINTRLRLGLKAGAQSTSTRSEAEPRQYSITIQAEVSFSFK